MTNHPHRGKRGQARKQWEAAAGAASALYRAHDARTATAATELLELAATRLRQAGLGDLAEWADDLACSMIAPLQAIGGLQEAVAEAAGKLEATYLEITP